MRLDPHFGMLPLGAFEHCGDRRIRLHGGGGYIPIVSDVVDIVQDIGGSVVDVIDDAVSTVGDVVQGVGNVVEDVVDKVVTTIDNTVTAALDDPVNTAIRATAYVYGGPAGLAAANAAIGVGQGQDLDDVAKQAAITYAAAQVGSEFSKSLSPEFGTTAANVAGQTASTVVRGGDPLAALLSGGVGAGVSEITKDIPGFGELSATQQKSVNTVIASALQGRDPSQALINQAINAGLNAVRGEINSTESEEPTFVEEPTPEEPTPEEPTPEEPTPVKQETYQERLSLGRGTQADVQERAADLYQYYVAEGFSPEWAKAQTQLVADSWSTHYGTDPFTFAVAGEPAPVVPEPDPEFELFEPVPVTPEPTPVEPTPVEPEPAPVTPEPDPEFDLFGPAPEDDSEIPEVVITAPREPVETEDYEFVTEPPQEPVTPTTPSPVTPAPVTPAPVTPAPVTPAPVTPKPTTPAAKSGGLDITALMALLASMNGNTNQLPATPPTTVDIGQQLNLGAPLETNPFAKQQTQTKMAQGGSINDLLALLRRG